MNKKQKKMLLRILTAAVLLAALHFVPAEGWLRAVSDSLPAYRIRYPAESMERDSEQAGV